MQYWLSINLVDSTEVLYFSYIAGRWRRLSSPFTRNRRRRRSIVIYHNNIPLTLPLRLAVTVQRRTSIHYRNKSRAGVNFTAPQNESISELALTRLACKSAA